MVNELIVRECQEDEAEAVLELWQLAETVTSPTDTLDQVRVAIKHNAASFLVAESGGRIIGTVIGTFDGWRGEMYRLAVLPEFRRVGVARTLVEAAEKWMAEQGCRRITALVEKDHPWATRFWDAAGYTPEPLDVRYVRNF